MNPKDIIVSLPGSWPSLVKAAGLVNLKAKQGAKITIWGHDDLDGIASTVIMLDALSKKAKVDYYIPPKDNIHYGLDVNVIDRLFAEGTELIITVDGGISNHQEAEYCRNKGLALIITDHHELPKYVPEASAVVNPKIPETGSPYSNLCGAGVSLYLAAAMDGMNSAGWYLADSRRLVWATLATVSDRVPLLEENRMIVKHGLKMIPEDPVLARLAVILGFDISHGLSPKILQNTFNSLLSSSKSQGHYHPMVELLLGTVNESLLAEQWSRQSEWRRRLEQELQKRLPTIAHRKNQIVVTTAPEVSGDMIGPLAGAIRDNLNLPAIVIGKKGNSYVGEARCFLPFDLVKMLAEFKEYFIQYGGHKQAAGFTVKPDQLEGLLHRIARYSDENQELILRSRQEFKYEFRFDNIEQLNAITPEILERGPFGPGNPSPNCIINDVRLNGRYEPGQTIWLDDLNIMQKSPDSGTTVISASLDATGKGQISLELLENQ